MLVMEKTKQTRTDQAELPAFNSDINQIITV